MSQEVSVMPANKPRYRAFARYKSMQRGNLLTILAVVLLIGASYFLVEKIKHNMLPENCHMAGFSNCTWSQFAYPADPAPRKTG